VITLQVRTGAECVVISIVSATEPLYAASCLRVCMEAMGHVASAQGASRGSDEIYSWTFAMGLKSLGTLFSLLPSEVLEEELVHSRELVKKVSDACNHSSLFILTRIPYSTGACTGTKFHTGRSTSDGRHGTCEGASSHTRRQQIVCPIGRPHTVSDQSLHLFIRSQCQLFLKFPFNTSYKILKPGTPTACSIVGSSYFDSSTSE